MLAISRGTKTKDEVVKASIQRYRQIFTQLIASAHTMDEVRYSFPLFRSTCIDINLLFTDGLFFL